MRSEILITGILSFCIIIPVQSQSIGNDQNLSKKDFIENFKVKDRLDTLLPDGTHLKILLGKSSLRGFRKQLYRVVYKFNDKQEDILSVSLANQVLVTFKKEANLALISNELSKTNEVLFEQIGSSYTFKASFKKPLFYPESYVLNKIPAQIKNWILIIEPDQLFFLN